MSRAEKFAVGEVGSGSRFAHLRRSRRAKLTSDSVRLDVIAEVVTIITIFWLTI